LLNLKTSPIDLLKIDRKLLLWRPGKDPDDRKKIVRSIIAMAHSWNIRVLAEGIEN